MRFLILFFAVVALGACAAVGPASYGAAGEGDFGYSETRIEQDRYRIVYRGSGGMPPEIVEDYALRRASEIALANGFDWFRVVDRTIERDQRGGVSVGAGFGTGSYGRRSGVSVGAGGDFGKIGGNDYFTSRMEVLMGEGDAPDDSAVYDARSISSSLDSGAGY